MNITYTYKCSICKKEDIEGHEIFIDGAIPNPRLPNGWNIINFSTVCEDHKIEVDGKLVQ